MYAYLISAMLLLTGAPLAVRAEEPPTAPAEEETQATEATAEELPYGSGYEARQRAQQQTRSREQARQRDRSEARSAGADARPARDAERASSARDARRDARERRTPRGPGG